MEKHQPKTQPKRPKITSFLGCFGYPLVKFQSNSKKNKVGCWLKFRSKKSVAKTVPVDGSATATAAATTTVDSEKMEVKKKFDASKSSWKRKPDEKPLNRDVSEVATVKTMKSWKFSREGLRKTRSKTAQKSAQQNEKRLDKADSAKKDHTCQIKQLLSQNTKDDDAVLSESNRPVSPDHLKPKTIRTTSVSSQPPNRTESKKLKQEATGSTRLDPLVGMSIILVTLLIMVLWGRLCAILCTSAWFYFIPKLRSTIIRPDRARAAEPNNPNSHDYLDLNSEEYKKKVVLEGFLERNRRNSSM